MQKLYIFVNQAYKNILQTILAIKKFMFSPMTCKVL